MTQQCQTESYVAEGLTIDEAVAKAEKLPAVAAAMFPGREIRVSIVLDVGATQ